MENKYLSAMQFRHATKEYDASKKISDEDFKAILQYGVLSPSSFGFEPWKFVVVQSENLRKKLKEFTWGGQGTLPTASHFMIILARKPKSMMFESDYIKHIMKDIKQLPEETQSAMSGFYEKFIKVDFELFENDRAFFDWASKQTYIALANMMTGAAYMGIDSCPLEGFGVKEADKFVKEELGIDAEEYGVSVMASFGYRKNEPKREKTRQNVKDVTAFF